MAWLSLANGMLDRFLPVSVMKKGAIHD